MGRPPKDNLRFATDRELQEMQRVLRGWDRVATLREALLLPDAPDGPSLTETERVVDAFFEGQLADALAVAEPGRFISSCQQGANDLVFGHALARSQGSGGAPRRSRPV